MAKKKIKELYKTEKGMDKITVKHSLPMIGKFDVELRGIASQIYHLFQSKEIKRLKSMLQLGQLCTIYSGAHHTRYDYVLLKLYLLKTFKDKYQGAGLGSNVSLLDKKSSLEVLQVYILLRNYGHLAGGFETERVLLELISTDRHIRTMFMSLVPSAFKSWAKIIIAKQKIFQFYQLLSIVFIENGQEYKNEPKLKEYSLKLLKYFFVLHNIKIDMLKDRHRVIRTLAFLSLDTHYTSLGIEFNLPVILMSAKEFGNKLFRKMHSGFQILNGQIDDYISDAIYSHPNASWVCADYRQKVIKKIARRLRQFRRSDTFFQYIESLKRDAPDYIQQHCPVYTKLPVKLPNDDIDVLPFDKAKELSLQLDMPNKNHIVVVSRPSSQASHAYIYHEYNILQKEDACRKRFKGMLEEIIKLTNKKDYFYKNTTVNGLDSLFRSLFYLLTDDKYEIEIERSGLSKQLSALCESSKPKAMKEIKKIIAKVTGYKHIPKAHMAELQCVSSALNQLYGGNIAICLSNIKICRKVFDSKKNEQREVAEIDGAIIVANERHTKLYIVESKGGRSRNCSDAREQLDLLFRSKVVLHESLKGYLEPIIDIPKKGAVLPIRLP